MIRGANVALLVAAVFADAASAADVSSLAFYGGWRDGGSFTDVATGKASDIRSSASFAASVDVPLDAGRQLQFLFSYQDSRFAVGPASVGPSPLVAGELPIHLLYLHVGGPVFFAGEAGRGAYVVGGLGATLFDPASSGYSSELRASANLGLGYEQPIGNRLALRIEARGYFTLVNSSGGLFCGNGGCAIAIRGDTVAQGEVSVGLAFRL